MDYNKWSKEYAKEGEKILRNIAVLKSKLPCTNHDEAKEIQGNILKFRTIYYECMMTAKHLQSRGGSVDAQ